MSRTAHGSATTAPAEKAARPVDVPLGPLLLLGFSAYALAVAGWFWALGTEMPLGPGRILESLYLGLSVVAPSDVYTAQSLKAYSEMPMPDGAKTMLLAARWLGAIFFILTVAKVALGYTYQGVLKRYAKWRYQDHVVIIGDRPFAYEAAREAARRDLRVVHFEPGGKETIPDGILTLDSDIGLPAMLEWSSAHRARAVIFATGDNADSAELAERLFNDKAFQAKARRASDQGIAASKARAGPHIFVFTDDAWYERREELDYSFHAPSDVPAEEAQLDSVVEYVGESRAAARALMTREPVFRLQKDEIQHTIVVGFGHMGQAILAELCESQRTDPSRKQRITILDPNPDVWTQFTQQVPAWQDVFDGVFIPRPVDALEDHQATFVARLKAAPPAAIYVTTGGGIDPMAAAADVKRVIANMAENGLVPEDKIGCPIFACARGGSGRLAGNVAAKIPADTTCPVLQRLPIEPFGSWRDLVAASRVLDDEPDLAAFDIHATHTKLYSAAPPANWSHLAEINRYSSRSAASYVPALLHAAGFDLAPWLTGTTGEAPSVNRLPRLAQGHPLIDSPSTAVKLARLEHVRWCAERYLRGFRRGPKDLDRKRHHSLVPFDALDGGSKAYNIQYIAALEDILFSKATGAWVARSVDVRPTVMRPTDYALIREADLDPEAMTLDMQASKPATLNPDTKDVELAHG
ncbi:MAG: hypothetical protein AAFR41_00515 [Pseudomonadota bacterium]